MSWSSVFFDLATHGGKAVIDHFSAKAKPQPQAAPVWPTLPTLPQMPQFELPRPPQVALPGVAVGAIEAPALHRSLPAEAAAPSYAEEFGMADDTSPVACWPCTRRHVNTALKAATATNLSPREAACTVMGEVAVWEQYDITEVKIRNTSPERRGAVLAAIPGMKRAAGCLQPPPASLHLAWAAAVEAYRFANSSSGNPSPMERAEADLRMEDVQGWVGVADTLPLGQQAAPHLDAIRHARHRLNRDGNTPEAIAQMRDALRAAAVALTPEPGRGALAEAAGNLQQARDAFYQGALGAMRQGRAPQAAPPAPARTYRDVDLHIPRELHGALLDEGISTPELLGATPQVRAAFRNVLAFDTAIGTPVREEDFPTIGEDGVIRGAYFPQDNAIEISPATASEKPQGLLTLCHETVHRLLHGPACDVYGDTGADYEDMPQEREANAGAALAIFEAHLPEEDDFGHPLSVKAVERQLGRLTAGLTPREAERSRWAAGVLAQALRGDARGAAAKAGGCPR